MVLVEYDLAVNIQIAPEHDDPEDLPVYVEVELATE